MGQKKAQRKCLLAFVLMLGNYSTIIEACYHIDWLPAFDYLRNAHHLLDISRRKSVAPVV